MGRGPGDVILFLLFFSASVLFSPLGNGHLNQSSPPQAFLKAFPLPLVAAPLLSSPSLPCRERLIVPSLRASWEAPVAGTLGLPQGVGSSGRKGKGKVSEARAG